MSLASGWLEILGLLVAGQATGGESSDTIFQVLGGSGNIIAILAMVAIAVGTVAVNAMNDYTGSLSLQAAGLRIKRIYSAAIVAVLGFLFTLYLNAQTDFAANFTNFLLFISYWIAPFVGVVLADWWLRGRRADVSSPERLRRAADRHSSGSSPWSSASSSGSRSRTRRSATAGAGRSTTSRRTTSTAPTSPTTWAGSWPRSSTSSARARRSAPRADAARSSIAAAPPRPPAGAGPCPASRVAR